MANQLENLCEKRGIKVEFITHNFIDSASEAKDSQPVIKVHKIFRECPMRVATAVVEIFTGEGYTSECIEIIERYLVEKYGSVGIRINPPKAITIRPVNPVNEEISAPNKREKNDDFSKEELYIEADISSIDSTNLKGVQKRLNDNEISMGKEQDVLELDIMVEPPIT